MVLDLLTQLILIFSDPKLKFGHHYFRLHEGLLVLPSEHSEAWTISGWIWNVWRTMWWLVILVHTLNNAAFPLLTVKTRKGQWRSASSCGPRGTRAARRRGHQGWSPWNMLHGKAGYKWIDADAVELYWLRIELMRLGIWDFGPRWIFTGSQA
jgi:hypothetical protein